LDSTIEVRYNSKIYSSNLKLLNKYYPLIASKISNVGSSFCEIRETGGNVNILCTSPNESFFLHDPEHPLQEASDLIKNIQLNRIEVLYVYGIGVGYIYHLLKNWLKENPGKYLVFLEDSLEVIQAFLQTNLATEILENPQVSLYDISDIETNMECIRTIVKDYIHRVYRNIALPAYEKYRKSTFSLIAHLICFETTEMSFRNNELVEYGAAFYRNFYQNLFELPSAILGTSLFNRFKDIPAIICGAGPSLTRQIPLLKKIQDKALIFGPGSSANILAMEGVQPHFGTNIDPNPDTYQRYLMSRGFEVPIFYRNRIYFEALKAIHGPRLLIPGATIYATANWFDDKFGIPHEKFFAGYSVIHTTIEIARRLGCNPIIFIGMSLSKKADDHYAQGIEIHPLYQTAQQGKVELGQPTEAKDIHGNTVTTYWPWVAEAQWIHEYSKHYSETTFINATEEGIGFFSVKNQSFEEAVKQFCQTSYPIEEMVHEGIIHARKLDLSYEQILEALQTFRQEIIGGLDRIQNIQVYLENTSKSNPAAGEKKFAKILDTPSYKYVLEIFDHFIQEYHRKERLTLNRIKDKEKRKEVERKLLNQRLEFLRQVLSINILTIEKAINNNPKPTEVKEKIAVAIPTPIKDTTQKILYDSAGNVQKVLSRNSLGQIHGTQLTFYPNGQLKSSLSYHKGLLDGSVILYYPDGQIKRMLYFIKHQREGADRYWYPNGSLFTECIYQNNSPKRARCWYPNRLLAKDLNL